MRNAECGERLQLAARTDAQAEALTLTAVGQTITVQPHQASTLRAPSQSGEFHLQQGSVELCHGVAHFADTCEADFSHCGPRNDLTAASQTLTQQLSKEDRTWPFFVLAILVAVLASWKYAAPRIAAA